MRIVGGQFRGRQFHPGKSFKARPTTDMAKESLFNILMNQVDFEEINVLDLFSGTGSISFEFVSRGCQQVTAVDMNYQHVQFIKSVIEKLDAKNLLKVIRANVFQYCEKTTDQFNLIFADPPYDHKRFEDVPKLVLDNDLLKKEGIFILEHSKNYNFSNYEEWMESRHYGSVHFSFFKK